MQVARVEFFDNEGQRVAEVRDPLTTTAVPIDGRSNTIRMRLSLPYAQGAKMPTTHESLNDPDFKRHNVQVVPSDVLNNLPYVPGKLVALDATTLLFELNPESPYSRGVELGWQKGEYRLFLAGVAKPGAGRVPIEDLSAQALDGEPHAPSGGTLSGNNVAGGDFSLLFRIG